MSARLLVIGARKGSLGEEVVFRATSAGIESFYAGISGEAIELDLYLAPQEKLRKVLNEVQPTHIVCTAGVNMPQPAEAEHRDWYRWHFEANVVGPMRLLEAFRDWVGLTRIGDVPVRHFVAISSNSAAIPRTASAAYCASKAALSMALRVKAREANGGDDGYIVYGYEPGWLARTPMSDNIEARFVGAPGPLHRMRGRDLAEGVAVRALAGQIVAGLLVPGAGLNGTLIRYDGGEQ